MHFIRNLSKYSPAYTEMIIKECGGIDAIFICMKDFDMNVRESALQAINSIVRQDVNISLYIVSSGKPKFIYQTKLLFMMRKYMNIKLNILKTYTVHITRTSCIRRHLITSDQFMFKRTTTELKTLRFIHIG